MPDATPRYPLTELADLAGVTPRTVRFYLAQGLLPSPGATGPGVKYGDDHLERLRLIRRLQREHLPLADIRSRLASLDPDAIAQLVEAADLPDTDRAPAPSEPGNSALDYVRRLLEPPPASGPPMLKRMAVGEAPGPPLLSSPGSPEPPGAPPVSVSIQRSQWERITLAADIELHVRRPLQRPQSRKVDRLVSIARELLEEDPS